MLLLRFLIFTNQAKEGGIELRVQVTVTEGGASNVALARDKIYWR
jgi:hypothetical protein